MVKEIFVDEWIYKPKRSKEDTRKIHFTTKVPLEPFQLYVIKLYKLTVSKKEDYNELMMVMKNLRISDRKKILSYIKKFLPGENKISNVRILKNGSNIVKEAT